MKLIISNGGLAATLSGIGAIFRFIGKAFISIGTVYLCWYIMTTYEPWKSEVNSVLVPLIVNIYIKFRLFSL